MLSPTCQGCEDLVSLACLVLQVIYDCECNMLKLVLDAHAWNTSNAAFYATPFLVHVLCPLATEVRQPSQS